MTFAGQHIANESLLAPDTTSPQNLFVLFVSGIEQLMGHSCVQRHVDIGRLHALQAISISHFINSALVTAVLVPRRISPASTTKPGKAPKNVDYVGNTPKAASMHPFHMLCSSLQCV